jgi:glycosyltransferase involved in cell wall biosynthesis
MKVLFVSHDASRTGAPLLLLWLVQWLRQHSSIEVSAILMRDGPLRREFEKVCPTYFWNPPPLFKPVVHRFIDRFGKRSNHSAAALLENTINTLNPNIVYLNTLVLGKYLKDVHPRVKDLHYISHGHELAFTLATMSSTEAVKTQLQLSSAVISCATAAQELLVTRYGLAPEKGVVLPEYIPASCSEEVTNQQQIDSKSNDVVERLTVEKARGTFIFGCVGSAISRKGFDLFPLLLKECAAIFKERSFLGLWLGSGEGSEARLLAEMDLEHMQVKNHALLLSGLPSAIPVISQLDVHCLLSREDPYPVVVLEAAALAVPTICFKGSGGIPEFVEQDKDLTVDYLDLRAFAMALLKLATHEDLRSQLGRRSQEKVFQQSSIDVVAPRIVATMEHTMEVRGHA